MRDFPLKLLNKPDFDNWYRTLSNFIFFPFITYGWRGWIDPHLLLIDHRPIIRNCIFFFQHAIVDRKSAFEVFRYYKYVSSLPAVQTRFLQGNTILIDKHDVHLVVLSDTTKSVVVYAAYVFLLYRLFGNKHLTYWIHPKHDTITLTFKGRIRGILRGVGEEVTHPPAELLQFWKRRGVLLARRTWEINVQRNALLSAISPDFLFSKNSIPVAYRKCRGGNNDEAVQI